MTERGATEIWRSTSPETIKTFWPIFAQKTAAAFLLLARGKFPRKPKQFTEG